jgi:hypothetical protein
MEQLIRKDMPVLGSDGGHVGTVDALVPGGRIRLTREDDPAHNHGYRHLPLHLVARVEAGQVRLTVPAQDAKAIAFGALSAGDEDDPQSAAGLGQVNNPGVGASVSDYVGQAGGGSGMVHGGGTTGHGGRGLGDEKPHGGGTGGGGTSRHGHLGSGPGIPGDPNMDPSGRGGDPNA